MEEITHVGRLGTEKQTHLILGRINHDPRCGRSKFEMEGKDMYHHEHQPNQILYLREENCFVIEKDVLGVF